MSLRQFTYKNPRLSGRKIFPALDFSSRTSHGLRWWNAWNAIERSIALSCGSRGANTTATVVCVGTRDGETLGDERLIDERTSGDDRCTIGVEWRTIGSKRWPIGDQQLTDEWTSGEYWWTIGGVSWTSGDD